MAEKQFDLLKIPKISPGAQIFQRPFLRGLYTEGSLRYKIGWAFTWRENGVSKSIGLAYSWKEIYDSSVYRHMRKDNR